MRAVLTSLDLRETPSGGELVLAPDTLVTPLAREDAELRGITLRVAVEGHGAHDGGSRETTALAGPGIVAAPGDATVSTPSDDGLIRAVTEEVVAYLNGPASPQLGAASVAPLIDHTLLKPEASNSDIEELCSEAIRFGFATVCVNLWNVPLAARLLHGSVVKVCCVVGFPLGATLPQIKMLEAEQAIKLGAQEIDLVQNVGALKSGQDQAVEAELRGVVEFCHRAGAVCKVILEMSLLSGEEKVRAALFAKRAGADFAKTSTGFASGGATPEDVALLRAAVGGEMGIKASGGIRTLGDLEAMVRAGASRIGTSRGVKIMEEERRRADAEPPSSSPGVSAAGHATASE